MATALAGQKRPVRLVLAVAVEASLPPGTRRINCAEEFSEQNWTACIFYLKHLRNRKYLKTGRQSLVHCET
jgi:hypothetical protein